jgi:hypothetical protein
MTHCVMRAKTTKIASILAFYPNLQVYFVYQQLVRILRDENYVANYDVTNL